MPPRASEESPAQRLPSPTRGDGSRGAVGRRRERARSRSRNDSRLPRAETGVGGQSEPPRASGESLAQRLPSPTSGDGGRRAAVGAAASERGVARATTPVSHAQRRGSKGGRSRRERAGNRPRNDSRLPRAETGVE